MQDGMIFFSNEIAKQTNQGMKQTKRRNEKTAAFGYSLPNLLLIAAI